MLHWLGRPKALGFIALLVTLAVAVACGGEATPTPRPTPSPTPAPLAATATPTPTVVAAPIPTPTAQVVASPTPEPAFTSKVDRLVVAMLSPTVESNLPWGGPITGFDRTHLYEHLMGVERTTGATIPQIATEWSLSADGKDWTFKLRKGVPFHFGWGEVTARDVQHGMAMVVQEGAVGDDARAYRKIIKSVEVVNDYEVVIHQSVPEGFTIPFYNTGLHGTSVIMSKAQWDKEGVAGYQKRPTGTSSYRYVSRLPGQSILAERVENHWRKTAEFKEIQLLFVKEAATRLALLLSGEAPMSALPEDLLKTAKSRGMNVVKSVFPGGSYGYFFGGQYYGNPELIKIKDSPWVGLNDNARLVRQAMNKAINRKEILETVYFGEADTQRVFGFHKLFPGYNPKWDDRWEEEYGYDPKRAKELLAKAGYPKGFKVPIVFVPGVHNPEQVLAGQLIGDYFKAIGLDASFDVMDAAPYFATQRDRGFDGKVFMISKNLRDPQITINFYNDTVESSTHTFETEFVHEKFTLLRSSFTKEDRHRYAQEIGDYKFNEFGEIPMFDFFNKMAVNPAVVAEYVWPGNLREDISHFEYIKAVR